MTTPTISTVKIPTRPIALNPPQGEGLRLTEEGAAIEKCICMILDGLMYTVDDDDLATWGIERYHKYTNLGTNVTIKIVDPVAFASQVATVIQVATTDAPDNED